ncbi:hypothetical protein P153DRAFT_381552 [Dothidotthia symphoricarpi CBS 119687]|uniref:Uncharacterized protein n=1 Tax=Dothidotthia symphoricarpi CBS 119687 TaxID=1392245 RepID=A0A6A6AMF1_9PLEO|nr:uncharacterized protein P153DRAFT_381552 [Dothidotthia symphoricarpi CBS 119687]KAF2133109.1 hypothetical protein P153DRAFT_381552 [Dothidotthia symphoricarpi CBS 119687]
MYSQINGWKEAGSDDNPGGSISPPNLTSKEPISADNRYHDTTSPSRRESKNERPYKSSDGWDLVDHDSPTGGTNTFLPSQDFPGTWDAAYNSTSHALREVTAASSSYITSLSKSGISQAGWSIGAALTSTANKSALSVVSWAAEKSGVDTTVLPGGVKDWLKGKDRLDKARQRVRNVDGKRLARRLSRVSGETGELPNEGVLWDRPITFGDARGAFVLDVHDDEESFLHARSEGDVQSLEPASGLRLPIAGSAGMELEDLWIGSEEGLDEHPVTKTLSMSPKDVQIVGNTSDDLEGKAVVSSFSSPNNDALKLVERWTPCLTGFDANMVTSPPEVPIPRATVKEDEEEGNVSPHALVEDDETLDVFGVVE